MAETFWIILILAIAMTVGFMVREARRRAGATKPRHYTFPAEWLAFLEQNVPLYTKMPLDLREDLQVLVARFIESKNFEHCGGLPEVTDEMKVTIAGNACLLILNRPTLIFRNLWSILVYPSSFNSNKDDEADEMLGEAWPDGSVVLAWDEVKKSLRSLRDGENLVMHEFAHQLDMENGEADGLPNIDPAQLGDWARVMSREFFNLADQATAGKRSVIDDYGADDPSEFFAVTTEAFFEKPSLLFRDHPEIYEQLKLFYKVDPARWGDSR